MTMNKVAISFTEIPEVGGGVLTPHCWGCSPVVMEIECRLPAAAPESRPRPGPLQEAVPRECSGMRRGEGLGGTGRTGRRESRAQRLGLSEADRQVRGPGGDLGPREEGRGPGPPGVREEGRGSGLLV